MVFIVVLILSGVAQMFLPWWLIIVISFATCGIIGKTGKISFWQPFLAIVVLWLAMALYKSIPNHHILATRVAEMIGVKLWYLTLTITLLLGGLTVAISGYCGYHFRKSIIALKAKA